MASIPKQCQICFQIYWLNHNNHFHICLIEKEQQQQKKPKKEVAKKPKPQIRDFICKDCGKKFQSTHKRRVFCSKECAYHYPIKKANEKWLNPKPKKKPKYSLVQLDRMAEWKRIHDDNSWTNRFNGYRG